MLKKDKILKKLKNKTNLIILNKTDSTNNYAKQNADTDLPLVIIAKKQTGGRGRLGRSFVSKKGGLYLSYVTSSFGNSFNAGLITACAAEAVATAIDEICGINCGIKWVNDIYINGKKVCGILTEGCFSNKEIPDKIIIGIGVNIEKNFATKEIKDIATSLKRECEAKVDINLLAASIINHLEYNLLNIDNLSFIENYRKKSIITDKEITVIQNDEKFSATALRIEDDCSLTVLINGTERNINFGEISIKV